MYPLPLLKDVGFKFEPHICTKCHDVLMTAYELKNIAILNAEGVDFRCILWGISRDEAANRLNNSVLDHKGVLQMDFGANKTPTEVIWRNFFLRHLFQCYWKVVQKVMERI